VFYEIVSCAEPDKVGLYGKEAGSGGSGAASGAGSAALLPALGATVGGTERAIRRGSPVPAADGRPSGADMVSKNRPIAPTPDKLKKERGALSRSISAIFCFFLPLAACRLLTASGDFRAPPRPAADGLAEP
jgi:hypothetical protein